MAIQVDNRFGTIDWEDFYQDYFIEVTDVDGPDNGGTFLPGVHQCWYNSSDELNFIILERAPDFEE